MIKQTTPLAKAITTLEGQLVLGSNLVVGLAGSPVLHALNPKVAGIVIAVQNIALLIQRGLVKTQASKTVNAVLDSPDPLAQMLAEVEAIGGVPSEPAPAADPAPAAPVSALSPSVVPQA